MRVSWVALVVACLFSAAAGQARGECASEPDLRYRLHVDIEIPEIEINRELGRNQLGAMAIHGPNERVLGVTSGELEMETGADYGYRETDDGYCFWVDQARVVLRYRTLDVYVAREYSTRSCAYRAVLAHEQQHVKISKEQLTRYAPRIRYALTSLLIPKPRAPKKVASLDEAIDVIDSLFGKLLQPIYQEMKAATDKAHGLIDSPQSYKRVRKQCRNW